MRAASTEMLQIIGQVKSVFYAAGCVALQGGHRQEATSLLRRVISNSDVSRRKKTAVGVIEVAV